MKLHRRVHLQIGATGRDYLSRPHGEDVFRLSSQIASFLATFYTLPESACLLAELAVERLDVDWSDRSAIEGLRVCRLRLRHWGPCSPPRSGQSIGATAGLGAMTRTCIDP